MQDDIFLYISRFKSIYFVRGDFHNRMNPETLNLYYSVFQCATVIFMLIFQCIIVLHSQIVDFANDFTQADISYGEPVLIRFPRYFNSNGGKCDAVLRSKKSLYGQAKATCLQYENL